MYDHRCEPCIEIPSKFISILHCFSVNAKRSQPILTLSSFLISLFPTTTALERNDPPKRFLCYFGVDPDPHEPADVIGDEPIWLGDEVVGWVTSGGYAHWSKKSVAIGYVAADKLAAAAGGGFEIELIGVRRKATLQNEPLFDPTGSRMRA